MHFAQILPSDGLMTWRPPRRCPWLVRESPAWSSMHAQLTFLGCRRLTSICAIPFHYQTREANLDDCIVFERKFDHIGLHRDWFYAHLLRRLHGLASSHSICCAFAPSAIRLRTERVADFLKRLNASLSAFAAAQREQTKLCVRPFDHVCKLDQNGIQPNIARLQGSKPHVTCCWLWLFSSSALQDFKNITKSSRTWRRGLVPGTLAFNNTPLSAECSP